MRTKSGYCKAVECRVLVGETDRHSSRFVVKRLQTSRLRQEKHPAGAENHVHVPLLLERMEFQESRFLAPSKDKLILASLAGDAESDDGSKCCLLLARVT